MNGLMWFILADAVLLVILVVGLLVKEAVLGGREAPSTSRSRDWQWPRR